MAENIGLDVSLKETAISTRRGDRHLQRLLYEAATVILTDSSADCDLWVGGIKLREKIGFKRAVVAVAPKLAVTMHAILKTDRLFEQSTDMAA